MSNRMRLAQLDDADLSAMPLDQIELLLEEVAELKARATKYASMIADEMARRFAERAAAERRAKGKDTGTVRLTEGDYTIVADLPKSVEWNSDMVKAAIEDLASKGEDPSEYVKVQYSIEERKFMAWPKLLQKHFEPARTVKAGRATFKIEGCE